jgi:hypothetical protein
LREVGTDARVDHASLVDGHILAIDFEGGASIWIWFLTTPGDDRVIAVGCFDKTPIVSVTERRRR